MSKQIIQTENAPSAIGPYSQATATDGLVFTAGQIPLDASSGKIVEGGIAEQTHQVLKNLKAVVEAGGSSMDKVMKTTVFLTDLSNFAEVNAIYSEYLGESVPARSTIQVSALPVGALVEIEAIAIR